MADSIKKDLRKVGCECVNWIKLKMTVFWDVAPRSLVEAYRRFKGACYLHHQGDES
jgi:hypothetical protein